MNTQKTKKQAMTKAFNFTLDVEVVKSAKSIITDISFSQYISDLIREDVRKRNNVKTIQEIFGNKKPLNLYHDAKSEKAYYELIGLKEYEIKSKK